MNAVMAPIQAPPRARPGVLEQEVAAGDQVHAGVDHRRRVDEGADVVGLHGVREPHVQGNCADLPPRRRRAAETLW